MAKRFPLNTRVVVSYGAEWVPATVVGHDGRKNTAVLMDDYGYIVRRNKDQIVKLGY